MRKSLVVVIIALLCVPLVLVSPSYGDFIADSWVTRTSMPTNSYGGKAVGIDGRIYVIGGFYSANNVYDPSTDNWTARTPAPNGIYINSLVGYQNKIYCIGPNATEVYDPSTDSWEAKTPMPVSITGIANILDGQIYVISGYNYPNANQLMGINEVYNISNDAWTTKASIPYPVSAYASTVCDNRIYILGGQDPDLGTNAMNVNFNQIYDPLNDSWSFGAPIPTKVLGATACATTGIMAPKQVYLFGGHEINDSLTVVTTACNLTQVYNPQNNSWRYGASMLSSRVDFAVAYVNDSLFVLGGSNVGLGAPYILSDEQYYPIRYGIIQPAPTPSVPELSWLVFTPLLVALFSIALVLRHRKVSRS